jgi:DNA-binding CsgD family transcriptional regulator
MECEEIARRENISAKAVYMAVFHLRQRLKKDTAA